MCYNTLLSQTNLYGLSTTVKAKLDSQQVFNSLKDHKSLSMEERTWIHSQLHFVKHTQKYCYKLEPNTEQHLKKRL